MTKRLIFTFPIICLLAGFACSQATSISDKTGIIGEVIAYEQGAVIVNAKITVSNSSLKREVRSDSNGRFEIVLPTGSYTVEVEALGFRKLRRKNLRLERKGFFIFNVNLDFGKPITVDAKHP